MRAIIFGGTGFFGKELVEILLNKGHHVTVVTRGNVSLKKHQNLICLVADRYNKAQLEEVTSDNRWDVAYDQLCFCSEEARLISDVLESKVDHFVLTSSKSVYDYGSDISEEVFEPTVHKLKMGERDAFDYAEGKRQAESYFAQKKPFSTGFFRPPVVIGPTDTTGRWQWHLERIQKGKPIFFPNLDAHFCVISAKDAALTLLKMGEDRHKGPLNFYTANPKLKDILTFMEEGCGKKALLSKEGEHSPYGIEKDWYMSRTKAEALGYNQLTDFNELAKELSK